MAPLSNELFRSLWLASAIFSFGATINNAGASWRMTEMTGSAQWVALIQTAMTLPLMLFALPVGALADIWDRRYLMLVSQFVGLSAAVGLAVMSVLGLMTPLSLLILTGLIGSSIALHMPAWQAALGDILPRALLPGAIGLSALAFNASRALGPAIAGLIIALTNATTVFAVTILSFAWMIAVLFTRRLPRNTTRLPSESMTSAMMAGLRYVGLSPTLKKVFFRGGLFGVGTATLTALIPLVAQENLHGGPVYFGALVGTFGLGSLTAALFVAYVRSIYGNEVVFNTATLLFGIATLVVGYSTWLPASLAAMFVAGQCWIYSLVTISTCTQLSCPRWVLGRTMALGNMFNIGGNAVGAALWGAVAHYIGLTETFLVAGLFLIASIGATFVSPLPSTEFDDISPRPPMDVPPPQLDVDNNSGPVIVTLQYRVPKAEALQFLSTMHELGRIRRRNGARRWSIQQDLDNSEIWFETIESPTWIDHLRRVERATIGDEAIGNKVLSYRVDTPGSVRRTIDRPVGTKPLD